MRIQHNVMSMNAYRNYGNNTSALAKNLEKLSSGYRVNRAGDDAAGLALSEKMRAQITGLKQAQRNVKDGIGLVQTAEGALQEVQDMLNRMDQLATQAANGIYQSKDRSHITAEITTLRAEIDRIGTAANFNGMKLFTSTAFKLQIGDQAGDKLSFTIGAMSVSTLKVNSFTLTSADKANSAIAKIKSAIDAVSKIRGTLGANQNRLEHTQNNLGVMAENIQEAESGVRDTDIADEMTRYTKNNILIQSAQAMLAQANQVPQGVLQLLQ